MAKKAAEGQNQGDKIRQMIEVLGWEAAPLDCVKYLKDTFDLTMDKSYVSQLRSAERKKQGLPPLRVRKGGRGKGKKTKEAAAAKPAAAQSPAASPASAADITTFVMELTKWQEKLGAKTVKEVLQTLAK